MKDTIGSRLQAAIYFAALANRRWGEGQPFNARSAEGTAMGHAFRAAELAYDLGSAECPDEHASSGFGNYLANRWRSQ